MDKEEIEAMALLLEREFGFDQHCMILAYKTDSWNFCFPEGSSAAGRPEDAPEGSEHFAFLVHYDIDSKDEGKFKEKAFKTAKEAAEFYIGYKNEHKL